MDNSVSHSVHRVTGQPGYRPQARDTIAEADRLEFLLLRSRQRNGVLSRSPLQRYGMARDLMKRTRQLSLQSIKRRFPHLTGQALAEKIARAWLQDDYPSAFVPGNNEKMWIQDPLEIAFLLHNLFESLQIEYFIARGSAAILYGEPRTTRDLDVVVSMQRDRLDEAIASLEESGFYVVGIEDVKNGRLNILQVIHMATIARGDLILLGTTPFDQMQLERRQAVSMEEGQILYYASPEDTILSKLQWQQQSQSEKQWRDLLGILKVQGELLDLNYLQEWAIQLSLSEDLHLVLAEAGLN
ncbi:hypothetical protein BI308_23985 [Roseofilum reptotaenium AO1-A]|uniref:Nucleotidyltransferase n=1 Tax=Roseofilum reptotaenium AO1-A TaxID=1925591 RepID=A0A1L9QK64_9CYAN|nr:hypothetical protein [Roseofilum reptotaenium]OJJ15957.1 hypothetical protein BI308_23985 [Roseofilum reptotaenium AO1-A]